MYSFKLYARLSASPLLLLYVSLLLALQAIHYIIYDHFLTTAFAV
ncbi:hypothetical protein FLA_1136 [Filimonas lacunae]|nr:hypothetical protein FLA_1136 [Filimonas lacunae]